MLHVCSRPVVVSCDAMMHIQLYLECRELCYVILHCLMLSLQQETWGKGHSSHLDSTMNHHHAALAHEPFFTWSCYLPSVLLSNFISKDTVDIVFVRTFKSKKLFIQCCWANLPIQYGCLCNNDWFCLCLDLSVNLRPCYRIRKLTVTICVVDWGI